MHIKSVVMAGIVGLGLVGCSNQATPARAQQAVVPVGEPQLCVETTRIRSTNVIDDQTIDFHMNNGTVLRNTLPHRCSGLGFQKSFAYSTSIARLCNVDTITVIDSGSRMRGATCGLGEFVPVKKAEEAPQDTATESPEAAQP